MIRKMEKERRSRAFLEGVASLFDIAGADSIMTRKTVRIAVPMSDADQMRADWQRVGEDLSEMIARHKDNAKRNG